jgi:hypothetical protein
MLLPPASTIDVIAIMYCSTITVEREFVHPAVRSIEVAENKVQDTSCRGLIEITSAVLYKEQRREVKAVAYSDCVGESMT